MAVTLKMEAAHSSETSVNYFTTRRYIAECSPVMTPIYGSDAGRGPSREHREQ
jgi:hypothetical protein